MVGRISPFFPNGEPCLLVASVERFDAGPFFMWLALFTLKYDIIDGI
jgi:hypothetical protein